MDRQLINYLPPFIQQYKEIKAIMDAEQSTFEKVWTDTKNVFNDQFIQAATENGVKRWESILGIIPKGTYTLDERKFDILARMNEQLPYTLETLKTSLSVLCGEEGYYMKLDANSYELTVKLALENERNFEAVQQLLYDRVPANMVINVRLFNTHSILSEFTHEQLAEYTHKQIREEVL